jgi:hypothetical protein
MAKPFTSQLWKNYPVRRSRGKVGKMNHVNEGQHLSGKKEKC